jgi:hypothetical protein
MVEKMAALKVVLWVAGKAAQMVVMMVDKTVALRVA